MSRFDRTTRRLAVAGGALALAAIPAAAHASTLNVTYDATGTSHVAKTNSDIALGPTTLSLALESADGSFTGHLKIPTATNTFRAVGLLPVSANVDFVEAAPVTGKLNRVGTTISIASTASYYIKLSNVKVLGLPAFAGNYCQTEAPVSIPANTPDGEVFSITKGGNLAGSFTIGNFENCGLNTLLINLLIPGAGNTAELSVSNGRLG